MSHITRRALMAAGASAVALGATQASFAQTRPKLRFSCAFPETDLRAEGYKAFAAAMKDDIDLEPYWSNTLFKQGTELSPCSARTSNCAISRPPIFPSRSRHGR